MQTPVDLSMSKDYKSPNVDSTPDRLSVKSLKTGDVEGDSVEIVDEAFLANEKSLVRKLDTTLMPAVFILYLFNYLDRNNIAYVPH